MNKGLIGAVAAVVLLAGCDTPPWGAQGRASETLITESAIVESVDYTTREVSLRDVETGETFSVVAGPEVQNLAQVEVGDQVNVDFFQSTTLSMANPGDSGEEITTVVGGRAEEGERPAGGVIANTSFVVSLVRYNPDTFMATYQLPNGRVTTSSVPAEFRSFARTLQPGARVLVSLTDAVAVSVTEVAA